MKFCKDCKYSEDTNSCWYPGNIHPITGLYDSCEYRNLCRKVRLDKLKCGPTAKWYEEKEKPIPKCVDCKWLICTTCHRAIPNEFTGLSQLLDHAENIRRDDSKCGKYGKWFEKKQELPPGTIIQVPKPTLKKQSWLCRLICGRKK